MRDLSTTLAPSLDQGGGVAHRTLVDNGGVARMRCGDGVALGLHRMDMGRERTLFILLSLACGAG
jgi:hypothetical protein